MAYPPKINEALRVLEAAGVSRFRAAPWSYRLLWSLGIPIRPPQFHGPFVRLVLPVVIYVTTYNAVTYLIDKTRIFEPDYCITVVISFVTFTIIYVPYTYLRTRKLNLPPWSEVDVADRFD